MFFIVKKLEDALRIFYKTFLILSSALCMLALLGFKSGLGFSSTLCGLFFLLMVAYLSSRPKFQENPFAVIFCVFTLLFLSIPTVFILIMGSDYIFGLGLNDLPFTQRSYGKSIPFGFLFLSICWSSAWYAMTLVKTCSLKFNLMLLSRIAISDIFILGLIVVVVSAFDRMEFSHLYLQGEGVKKVSLVAILMAPSAFLALVGAISVAKINLGSQVQSKEILFGLTLVFIIFFMLISLQGSKAATLTETMLLIIIPLSINCRQTSQMIVFPKFYFLLATAILIIPVYFLVSVSRDLKAEVPVTIELYKAIYAGLDLNIFYKTAKAIFYRLSMGGLDRFLLIFQSFIIDGYSLTTSTSLLAYMAKNMANLLLPGTIFPEAYAPSSQLFLSVIANQDLDGSIGMANLMRSFNTQSFTIFGLFTIMFGLYAPLALFFFFFIMVKVFDLFSNYLWKLAIGFLFWEVLACYGFEISLANCGQFLLGMLTMFFTLKYLSRQLIN